ncbi:MAG: rhodanese-like domain-containing protein [Acidobacteriaceae bacterium]
MKHALALVALLLSVGASAQMIATEPALIQPQELAAILQSNQPKPLILNIGPSMLYAQAHITGAEYIGATSEEAGRQALRSRVKNVPKKQSIVLYCGCCPWSHCPNVHPAYKELVDLGFRNVKVLYIANNFGADWVYRGYPTERGR